MIANVKPAKGYMLIDFCENPSPRVDQIEIPESPQVLFGKILVSSATDPDYTVGKIIYFANSFVRMVNVEGKRRGFIEECYCFGYYDGDAKVLDTNKNIAQSVENAVGRQSAIEVVHGVASDLGSVFAPNGVIAERANRRKQRA